MVKSQGSSNEVEAYPEITESRYQGTCQIPEDDVEEGIPMLLCQSIRWHQNNDGVREKSSAMATDRVIQDKEC